jgi:cell division protein FtsB
MNTAEQILVVILAAALAVFLVLAITATVYIIRLLKILNEIAEKAEHLVNSAEAVSDMVRQTVGRLTLLRFVRGVVDLVQHKEGKKGSE